MKNAMVLPNTDLMRIKDMPGYKTENAGFCRQPVFILQEGLGEIKPITYRADFVVFHLDGTYEIVDTKGFETETFKLKQKMFLGEREWASVCREEGYNVRRTQQYCGGTEESADCIGLPYIHQEVKRVERLNIYDAMTQSRWDSTDGEIPIVAHRTNRMPWLVTMLASDWFCLYREWEASKDIEGRKQDDDISHRI